MAERRKRQQKLLREEFKESPPKGSLFDPQHPDYRIRISLVERRARRLLYSTAQKFRNRALRQRRLGIKPDHPEIPKTMLDKMTHNQRNWLFGY